MLRFARNCPDPGLDAAAGVGAVGVAASGAVVAAWLKPDWSLQANGFPTVQLTNGSALSAGIRAALARCFPSMGAYFREAEALCGSVYWHWGTTVRSMTVTCSCETRRAISIQALASPGRNGGNEV